MDSDNDGEITVLDMLQLLSLFRLSCPKILLAPMPGLCLGCPTFAACNEP